MNKKNYTQTHRHTHTLNEYIDAFYTLRVTTERQTINCTIFIYFLYGSSQDWIRFSMNDLRETQNDDDKQVLSFIEHSE